jgi:hypothetical protein
MTSSELLEFSEPLIEVSVPPLARRYAPKPPVILKTLRGWENVTVTSILRASSCFAKPKEGRAGAAQGR